ncbi:ABC-2 type transport system permease protein [Frankineae bacterium MT45]|nr:ABC-2 type transport system permease protein [Frankineae bacterium MT45]
MTWMRMWATTIRIFRQLRRDPRTLAMLIVVPVVLTGLMAWILPKHDFDHYGPIVIGLFPLIIMFLITSVTTLRERVSGTLERLLTMPMGRAEFVFGYAIAFGLISIVQALVTAGVSFGLFGLDVQGSAWLVVVIAVMDALLGTAMGLFVSAFATTEFQAVQFMPLVLLPQLILCGIIVPRDELPTVLHWVSDVLPLSYAIDATKEVLTHASATSAFWRSILVIGGFVAAALIGSAATLRRRTP